MSKDYQGSPEAYREQRKKLGTQAQVAAMLNISRETLTHRENGSPRYAITREAELAMEALGKRKKSERSIQ